MAFVSDKFGGFWSQGWSSECPLTLWSLENISSYYFPQWHLWFWQIMTLALQWSRWLATSCIPHWHHTLPSRSGYVFFIALSTCSPSYRIALSFYWTIYWINPPASCSGEAQEGSWEWNRASPSPHDCPRGKWEKPTLLSLLPKPCHCSTLGIQIHVSQGSRNKSFCVIWEPGMWSSLVSGISCHTNCCRWKSQFLVQTLWR